MNSESLRKKQIAENFFQLQQDFRNLASDHPPRLVAVSKTFPAEDVRVLYELGQRDFGENRVQELKEKAEKLCEWGIHDIHWHFLGKIQSNKMKTLMQIPGLSFLHSVDSLSCLKNLLKVGKELAHSSSIGLFLQVNTSQEEEKQGFRHFDELEKVIEFWKEEEVLGPQQTGPFYLQGLMTMGKIRTENILLEARECFIQLKNWKNLLEHIYPKRPLLLSMGMSQDFAVAIEVGTDWVRVGSSLFGAR